MLTSKTFIISIVALLALRFLHFGPDIDQPHDWRQSDTAYYIQDFYEHGIDLLHPRVCYMGNKNVLALEFPLPEAIVALGYHITGISIPFARLVFLLIFCVAVFYFYRICNHLFDQNTARIATVLYMAMPLNLFYSRAIHIDFSAILCAHMMVNFYLLGIDRKSWKWLLVSSVIASFGFAIKAPYLFYWLLPMLFYAVQANKIKWLLYRSYIFILPLLSFFAWQWHVNVVNNASPEWDYIIHYHKMVQSTGWYFGNFTQRLKPYSWYIVSSRLLFEVVGIGVFIVPFALPPIKKSPQKSFFIFWSIGLLIYLLLFFNLNFVHNYYQIPFTGFIAVLVAMGLIRLFDHKEKLLFLVLIGLAILNIFYAETHYYKLPKDEIEIASVIQKNTPDSSLVIVTYELMDCRNPKILYRANRKGWSLEKAGAQIQVVQRLHKEEGASFWAFVGKDAPIVDQNEVLEWRETKVIDLHSIDQKVYLYALDKDIE